MDDEGCPEGEGHPKRLRIVEVATKVGKVDPVIGSGVIVQSEGAGLDHLVHEQPGQPRGQGTLPGPGKAAVQIPAVGQVAGLGDEAEDVHHRNGHHGPCHGGRVQAVHHVADDLHADDLVAVDGAAQPDGWARPRSVNDLDRHREPRARREPTGRELEAAALAREQELPAEAEGALGPGHLGLFGKDVVFDPVHDLTGHVDAGGSLDAFEAR